MCLDSPIARKHRRELALELGLSESASWADINRHNDDLFRRERAQGLGLPESASWGDIRRFTAENRNSTIQSS